MNLIELEKPQGISKGINWVPAKLVNKNVDVKLLVSPVYLKERLKSGQELV